MEIEQDLITRLNKSGKRLSKSHRRIADYLTQHYDKAVYMTASKLGEVNGVSESTVVRYLDDDRAGHTIYLVEKAGTLPTRAGRAFRQFLLDRIK